MKIILFAILGVLLGFLMGAFYNVGFDISLWSEGSRLLTLLLMTWLSGTGVAVAEINK